jgi:hypothetical protein
MQKQNLQKCVLSVPDETTSNHTISRRRANSRCHKTTPSKWALLPLLHQQSLQTLMHIRQLLSHHCHSYQHTNNEPNHDPNLGG